MRFIKYFFGDPPSGKAKAILEKTETDELIYNIIYSGQHAYIPDDLYDKNYQLVCALSDIGVLKVDENAHTRLAAPVFMKSDLPVLKEMTSEFGRKMAGELITNRKNYEQAVDGLDAGYTAGEHLYHLLCGAVFDGCFFDQLGAAGVITVSKPQKYGQDYLPVLYEDDEEIWAFSAGLLCSYNRVAGSAGTFSSFGDANGSRHDIFRWYRKRIQGETMFLNQLDKLYDKYGCDEIVDVLAEVFSDAISGKCIEKEFTDAFEWAGYMENGHICVPVYHKEELITAVENLGELTRSILFDDMCEALHKISNEKALISVKLGIDAKDIANEIYHLIFGQINEELTAHGFVTAPPCINGQGRFLRCFEKN